MSQRRLVFARRSAAVLTASLAMVAASLAVPTAAHAATTDLSTNASADTPSVTGLEGSSQAVYVNLVNLDPVNRTGPATMQVSVTGSTLEWLEDGFSSCTPSAYSPDTGVPVTSGVCTYPNGLSGGRVLSIRIEMKLGVTGSVSVAAVLPGDTNPANDIATIPITVTQAPPAVLTLAVPAKPVPIGSPARLTVKLTDPAGAPLPYELVTIMRQDVGATAFVRVTDIYAGADGTATVDTEVFATATYVAVYAPRLPAVWGYVESVPTVVRVIYVVTAAMSPVAVPPGSVALLTLAVRAGVKGAEVTVQQRIGKGAWKSIGHPKLLAGGKAQIRVTNLRQVGTHTFRVIRGADAAHEQGEGQTSTVVTTTGKGSPRAWVPLSGSTAQPGRWHTCAPITYYVNTRQMPATGMADLTEALRRVSMASGMKFRYGGRRSDVPTPRYIGPLGEVVFAWANPTQSQGLLHPFAGGVALTLRSRLKILTGAVVINSDMVKRGSIPPGFGEGSSHGLVLMHEIGHVLGLGHFNEPWSIMHPSASLPAAVWGAGDLVGLRAVGRAKSCGR